MLRTLADANLYNNVTPSQVQGVTKNVNDRPSENLTYEYSLGYNPSGGAQEEHAGMRSLGALGVTSIPSRWPANS